MKRTADINENLKPLKDTPYWRIFLTLFRLPTFSTEENLSLRSVCTNIQTTNYGVIDKVFSGLSAVGWCRE